MGPFPIKGTVDSPIAKAYLERQTDSATSAQQSPSEVHQGLKKRFGDRVPTREELSEVSKEYSVDLAAAFFAEQLLAVPKNTAAHRLYFHYLKQGKEVITEEHRANYVVVLVPGYDHVATGYMTGASLVRARQIFDEVKVKNLFADLNPVGTIEENAQIIADLISQRTLPTQKVVISGASSGGAAIHYALGNLLPRQDAQRVVSWVNLGGLMNGARALDWYDSSWRSLFFRFGVLFTRWGMDSLKSMSVTSSRDRVSRSTLLPQMAVINLMGLSLSGSITPSDFSQYDLLRESGPNDGFSYLPEMILPDTLTIIAPECDHFFGEDPFIQLKALALFAMSIDIAEQRADCDVCWRDQGRFPSSGLPTLSDDPISTDWRKEYEIFLQVGQPSHSSSDPP